MSTTADLVIALKKELKNAQMTYADLAQALGMAESSVKRMLAKGDMPLSRIDAICRTLALDLPTWPAAWPTSSRCSKELTQEQERPWWPTKTAADGDLRAEPVDAGDRWWPPTG